MVDGTGLENRHTRKGIGGSNPSLSAIPFLAQASAVGLFLRNLPNEHTKRGQGHL